MRSIPNAYFEKSLLLFAWLDENLLPGSAGTDKPGHGLPGFRIVDFGCFAGLIAGIGGRSFVMDPLSWVCDRLRYGRISGGY